MVVKSGKRIITLLRPGVLAVALLGLAPAALAINALQQGQEELLEPDKAFALSTRVIDANTLEASWKIADGYYLYRDKFKFKVISGNVKLGTPVLPKGKVKQDPTFGKVETYTKNVAVTIPLKRRQATAETIKLRITSQGCNDPIGVCYPPATKLIDFKLPATENPGTDTAGETRSLKSLSSLIDKQSLGQQEFLPPDQAFKVSAVLEKQNFARINFEVTPGYYLYKNKIGITGNGVGEYSLPKGKIKDDPLFGKTETYPASLFVNVPLSGPAPFKLDVAYQGCADKGICYPPATKSFTLTTVATTSVEQAKTAGPETKGSVGTYLVAISGAFIIGLLLTFTPCVLPMIPILSSVIVGQGGESSRLRGGTLAAIYVLGTAVTYTAAGILAGATGEQLQAYFQNVWTIGIFSAILVLLALSMFGFYELQMPSAIQSRLQTHSQKIKGGSFIGVFIIGVISALIVGACVSPLLISALGAAIAAKDPLLGGLIMFSMAMGMGVVLIAIGFGAGFLLPKAGMWMERVKHFFGVMLLGVAVYLLGVLPQVPVLFLWALLLIVTSIYFGATQSLPEGASGWRYFWKGIGTIMLIWGVLALVGGMSGNRDILRPVSLSAFGTTGVGPSSPAGVYGEEHLFEQIKTMNQLESRLEEAKTKGQPVIVDFFATWCTDCIRMEQTTFKDPQVRGLMKSKFMLLQIDVTDVNNQESKAIKKRFGVFGPPAMLFLDSSGEERKDLNFYGYKSAKELIDVLKKI